VPTRSVAFGTDILLNPPPLGIKNQFMITQGGFRRAPAAGPLKYGSLWLFYGFYPSIPVTRLEYTYAGTHWLNTLGGHLLDFDVPVPYPTAYGRS
jgi:hypothetical protein